jgi:hypothetical protein
MNEPPEDIRQLLRGIGARAAILGIGGLLVTGGTAVLALRAASVAIKFALGATLLLVGGGMAAYEVQRAQRALAPPTPIA